MFDSDLAAALWLWLKCFVLRFQPALSRAATALFAAMHVMKCRRYVQCDHNLYELQHAANARCMLVWTLIVSNDQT